MPSEKDLFLNYVGQTSPSPLLIEVDRAEGIWIYGKSNEKYLDLVSGVSVSNVGHSHPAVIKAAKQQLDKYAHLMVYGEIIQSPQVNYARKLLENLPQSFGSVYFVNSGSEAIEGAMKLAKRCTGRSKFVSFKNSYHGSTHGALSIQGVEYYRNAFRPLLPDMYQVEFNNPDSLLEIDDKCAAVIVEPIQAEAGIIHPVDGFLSKLRKRCDETGAMLIFDEIQTGFGRTGDLFALYLYNVVPDILAIAKAMGGGLPLGAFISSRPNMSKLSVDPVLGHITTFGGHPLSCATGLAAFDLILENKLHLEANNKGRRFVENIKDHRHIKSLRGSGLFYAVELHSPDLLSRFVDSGVKNGMILDKFLFCNNAFRIAPPLTITNDEIDLASEMIISALDKL
ncbi:MAG: aspartate aminotransferase family protein [Marinilabiliaceae bacterium]|jgi:acetylornithine/succinyldiaminopimelate/putrescine aminotransferase|nr:aspartate aminotransferase family protein [Marinilabiliaceae bacterium]